MTLETCDWLESGALLHVVNTVHVVLIRDYVFLSPERRHRHATAHINTLVQANVDERAREACTRALVHTSYLSRAASFSFTSLYSVIPAL